MQHIFYFNWLFLIYWLYFIKSTIHQIKFVNFFTRYTVQSVQSCQQATFHCVHIWRRTNNVLEIKIGKSAPNNEDACHEQLFFDNSIPIQTITCE